MSERITYPAQRVAVLIDVQNFYHSAKNIYKRRVNFKEILKHAVSDRQIIRAYAYVVSTEGGEEEGFFEVLKKMGIEIRVKDLQIYYGGLKKADWDVGIVVDAVKLSAYADAIVLLSGDGDFVPMVEYLKNKGVQAEVMAFGKSASSKLKEKADYFIDLDENPEKFLLKQKAR